MYVISGYVETDISPKLSEIKLASLMLMLMLTLRNAMLINQEEHIQLYFGKKLLMTFVNVKMLKMNIYGLCNRFRSGSTEPYYLKDFCDTDLFSE